MARLVRDPNLDLAPDFASENFVTNRELAIAAQPELTEDQAAQKLLEAWTTINDSRKIRWEAERVEREADEAAIRALAPPPPPLNPPEPAPEIATPEVFHGKKKLKLAVVAEGKQIVRRLRTAPSGFAISKVENYEYVELSYFTTDACSEAARLDSITESTATAEDMAAVRLANALKPSLKAIKDEDIPWLDMSEAKLTLIETMEAAGWPSGWVAMLDKFFFHIENHALIREPDGRQILKRYMAKARREWHKCLKDADNEAFDISLINEELMTDIRDAYREQQKVAGNKGQSFFV